MTGTTPSPEPQPVRRSRHREIIWLIISIFLLLIATLPPLINLGRWQRRIADAISRSISRPVSMDSVTFRLLPWPAFIIQNFTIGETQDFGSEPALHAPEVVAQPSLLSLWRGRFELSRIEMQDASVNLIRNAQGRWNVGSILLQASHIDNSPTGNHLPGRAPRFPYIDARNTRINVKQGAEKLPYSLLNADFSMWLAKPGVWNIQLQGQPARTDLAMSAGDTGTLNLQGELHRATAFGAMPVVLHAEWSQASIAQIGRLIYSEDPGWRGDADISADFTGEPEKLAVSTKVHIGNLHRQEFTPSEAFAFDATCHGTFTRSAAAFRDIGCLSPASDSGGAWKLRGNLHLPGAALPAGVDGSTPDSLELTAQHVPASWFARAASLVRPGAPSAAIFTGIADGSLRLTSGAPSQLSGTITMPKLTIAGAAPQDAALTVENLSLAPTANNPTSPTLLLTTAPIAMGVDNTLTLSGELNRTATTLRVSGTAALANLRPAAHALRLPTMLGQFAPVGTIDLGLATTQSWVPSVDGGDTGNSINGTLALHNAQWQPRWLVQPLILSQAQAVLSSSAIHWSTDAATLQTTVDNSPQAARLTFRGTAEVPLHCSSSDAVCVTQLSISTAELDANALSNAAGLGSQPLLQRLLNTLGDTSPAMPPPFHAAIQAGTLTLGKLPIHAAVANISFGDDPAIHGVRIANLDGQTLHGTLHVQGLLHLDSSKPAYALDANWNGLNAHDASQIFNENWGGGALNGSAHILTEGNTASDLFSNMSGTWRGTWLHGTLGPGHFSAWDGEGTLGGSGITIRRSTLMSASPAPSTSVTGVIHWDRSITLTQQSPGAAPQQLTGTLSAASTK